MRVLAAILGLLAGAASPAITLQDSLTVRHEPKHKGGADLATGLYVREDEDIVINGTPLLILRRTYLAKYRVSRHFGVGTTHNGEIYLHGDFQRMSLIQAEGSRIAFERRAGEPSLFKAIWVHEGGPAEWVDAEIRFALFGWRMKRGDGSELVFQSCGPGTKAAACSIIQSKDADGYTINYRRDLEGRLLRMEADDRWIAFDYDGRNRVTRALGSNGASVEYQYDQAGRLWQVFAEDGRLHRYMYTDRDELARISDPGHTLENTYDANSRLIRQVNRFAGDPEPLEFTFSYGLKDGRVVSTESTRSDGESSLYTFDENGHVLSQRWRVDGRQVATLEYERSPLTRVLTAITISCTDDPTGRRSTHPIVNDDASGRERLAYRCLPGNR